MEAEDNKTPILNIAWTRYAHFDSLSNERTRLNSNLRKWIAILGILATLFAILTQIYPKEFPEIPKIILGFILICLPIISSILAAFTNKFFGGGDWLVMRAGAEEILKEIFKYRTILQKSPDRRQWLESRLVDIQRRLYRGLGGEMVLKDYNGPIPPYDDPTDPTDDAGFNDLTGEQYFNFRVESQLAWHMRKLKKLQAERIRLQIYILLAGGAGAILAALGGIFSLFVALTASFVSALLGWQELRNLDTIIKNYSKVQLELMVIYDHWNNLDEAARTDAEFYAMVTSTEDLLWSQNVEYIKAMQEALAKNKEDDALVNDILKKSVEEDARLKASMKKTIVEGTEKALTESSDQLAETFKKTFGSLAEEAASPLVQAELAAMQKAASETVTNIVQSVTSMKASFEAIAAEFAGVKVDGDTPVNVLNDLISRYPVNSEPKG